jgi:hypothetical protein
MLKTVKKLPRTLIPTLIREERCEYCLMKPSVHSTERATDINLKFTFKTLSPTLTLHRLNVIIAIIVIYEFMTSFLSGTFLRSFPIFHNLGNYETKERKQSFVLSAWGLKDSRSAKM